MELNNTKRRSSSHKINKKDSYSDSDEELFNKSINTTKREFSIKAKELNNKATISNSEPKSDLSKTHEYSAEDIQKFEKLITKDNY